jgi:hypothetical protein
MRRAVPFCQIDIAMKWPCQWIEIPLSPRIKFAENRAQKAPNFRKENGRADCKIGEATLYTRPFAIELALQLRPSLVIEPGLLPRTRKIGIGTA